MSDRVQVDTQALVQGRPVTLRLITNPTIEDVLIAEARVLLADLDYDRAPDENRRVERGLREHLIRVGVE